jgi:hypothetical protein
LFKYLPKINIKEHHESGTEYFRVGILGGKNIFVDVGRVIDLSSSGNPSANRRGAYATIFHEIGHAVDYLMDKDGYFNSTSINGIILQDVDNSLRSYIETFFGTPLSANDYADIQTIMDSLQRGGTALADPTLNAIRTQVQSHYANNVLNSGSNDTASDVYGGATGNNIRGTWGHPDIYWDNREPNGEFFANAFSRYLTGHADGIISIESNFPNASIAFINLIEAVM